MSEIILPQIVSIGIYDSRLAIKNRDITKNRKTSMFEIELPIENGGISYINEDKTPITPNEIICAKPGQTRHTKLSFKCYFIHMVVKGGVLYDILMDTPNHFTTEKADEYKKIFMDMCRYYEGSLDNDNIILHSLILKLVHTIYSDCKKLQRRSKTKSNNYELIDKAMKFIDKNLTSQLALEDIAKHVSLSPIYFHNSFKAATGKTPHEYLNEKRIKKAANLLVTTDLSLAQIAYECGFSSQSYFSYSFKKHMKLTPREYMHKMFDRY